MTDPQRGEAVTGRPGLTPRGVDIAVAVGVFGASVVNVATQDPATEIADIPVAGFLLLAIASVAGCVGFNAGDDGRLDGARLSG
jgi:hypothetical protein